MLKSFHVAPLGQNYTEFLESSHDKSLATFLQERLEKYKECTLRLAHSHEGTLTGDLSAVRGGGGVDALVDGLIAIHDDTRAVLNTENWGALPAFWDRCKYSCTLTSQIWFSYDAQRTFCNTLCCILQPIVDKTVSQLKLLRINKDDFETLKALTRGQYGKVHRHIRLTKRAATVEGAHAMIVLEL